MVEIIALIGLLIGALLVWASDYLPCFSENFSGDLAGSSVRSMPTLSVWAFVRARLSGQKSVQKWLPLHVGVELLSAAAGAFLYSQNGLSLALVFSGAVFSFFLLIAVIDLKYRLVLNMLTYPAMIVVLIGQVVLARYSLLSVMLGGGLAFGIFFLTARLKPGDLGGGDVKLATLIGLAFGFPGVLLALIAGAGSGALVAIILFNVRRDGEKLYFPYAPFLCLGAIAVLMYSPFFLKA